MSINKTICPILGKSNVCLNMDLALMFDEIHDSFFDSLMMYFFNIERYHLNTFKSSFM